MLLHILIRITLILSLSIYIYIYIHIFSCTRTHLCSTNTCPVNLSGRARTAQLACCLHAQLPRQTGKAEVAFKYSSVEHTRCVDYVCTRVVVLFYCVHAIIQDPELWIRQTLIGWHCVSNATCLIQPHLFSTAFLV